MRSPAEASNAAFGRSSDLLEQVDYRLAQTPEEKEEIYNLRYRAYLREGAVKESPEQRVTDQYDDLPNSWTFGVYLFGELYSSVRISVLTPEWREFCSAEAFGEILHPQARSGRGHHRSRAFRRRSRQGQAAPGTALSDAAAGLYGLRIFQRRSRAGDRACRASGVLPPRVSARDHRRAPLVPRPSQAGRTDGGGFSGDAARRSSNAIR